MEEVDGGLPGRFWVLGQYSSWTSLGLATTRLQWFSHKLYDEMVLAHQQGLLGELF